MNKEKTITGYALRVSAEGVVYRPYLYKCQNELKSLQEFVGGRIEVIHIDDLEVILNEEGKLQELPFNRLWLSNQDRVLDILQGNVLVVRAEGENFSSIEADDINKINQFLPPYMGIDFDSETALTVSNIDMLPEYKEE